jgi:hypothetical protein
MVNGNLVRIQVDKSMQDILEDIRKNVADDLKKRYGLKEITIYGTVASQILAAKYKGKKFLDFRIKKVGLTEGILELIS